MNLRAFVLSIIFLFEGCTAQAQINLNPALFGCIMSGGTCMDNTGIFIIDQFLGNGVKVPMYTREDECHDLHYRWCSGNGGYNGSGFVKCREAKKAYYKQKAEARGEWIPSTQQIPGSYEMVDDEYNFQRAERLHGSFICNGKQRQIYMKVRCGVNYMDWRYLDTNTLDCDNDSDDD